MLPKQASNEVSRAANLDAQAVCPYTSAVPKMDMI